MAYVYRYVLGEVSQGKYAGTKMFCASDSKKAMDIRFLYNNPSEIASLDFGELTGFFKNKFTGLGSISTDDVVEVKLVNEVGNDIFYQLTYSDGEISMIKTWKNLALNNNIIVHPASTISELFIAKLIK